MIDAQTAGLAASFEKILRDSSLDKAFVALLIAIPSELYLAEQMTIVDAEAIRLIRESLKMSLALALKDTLTRTYLDNNSRADYSSAPSEVGRRSLKNIALGYLMSLEDNESLRLCLEQYQLANNMTDKMSAMSFLADKNIPERAIVLEEFIQKWQNDPLVMNLWFSVQASSRPTTLDDIKELTRHPAFDWTNPNKLRALIGSFCQSNFVNFHRFGEDSYKFLADQVLKLDKVNPLMAARLISPLTRWKRLDNKRRALMKNQLEYILQASQLSKDVYEVASKSLK